MWTFRFFIRSHSCSSEEAVSEFPCHDCFHRFRYHFGGPVIIVYIKNYNGNIIVPSILCFMAYGGPSFASFHKILPRTLSGRCQLAPFTERKQTKEKEGACSNWWRRGKARTGTQVPRLNSNISGLLETSWNLSFQFPFQMLWEG